MMIRPIAHSIAVAAVFLLSPAAFAKDVQVSNHTNAQLASSCAKGGGQYGDTSNGGAICWGKNGNFVDCNGHGKCHGWVAGRLASSDYTIFGIDNNMPPASLVDPTPGGSASGVPSHPIGTALPK